MCEIVANGSKSGTYVITGPGPKFRTDVLFLPHTLSLVAKICSKKLYQRNENGGDGVVFRDYLIHPPL